MCKSTTTKWTVVLDDGLLCEDTTVAADRFDSANGFVLFLNGGTYLNRPGDTVSDVVAAFKAEAVISITKKGNK